jgi:hypothetical protein
MGFKTIIGFWVALLIVGFLCVNMPPNATTAKPADIEAKNQSALAFGACVRSVENSAKYDLRWTSWGSKFQSPDGITHPDGTILFFGDEAEAQNGFGAWVRVNYSCVFDPKTKQTSVEIAMGRLPR